ncbi:MAG: HAD hydrolase-like protein [Bacteroidales bacterium]|nr:HAD hydrolase-like protein [Bacteroidales bacterium]
MEMLTKTIIFDFDGTIADTLETIAILYNKIASDFNCKPVSFEEKEKFRSMKTHDFLKECNIPILLLPLLALRIKSELKFEIRKVKVFSGVAEALLDLKKLEYQLGVMSSNSVENIHIFLKEHNIDQLFDFVHSGKNIFGKDKVLLRLLHKYKIKRNSVIYVGDETRDIEALKRIKIPIIAVSWGFNSHSILEKFNPNALIDDPSELIGEINDLSGTQLINS